MNLALHNFAVPGTVKRIAVGYIRCSTDMQAETSPDQQKNLILEYAEKNGYWVSDWFVDIGKSGTSFDKRPAFARLKAAVESHPEFSDVLVLDESRWGRAGADEGTYYKMHFKKTANVGVVVVRTIARTGNAAVDSMLGAFESGLSQEESVKKSERTYDGCVSAINKGHSAGGIAPYGYRRVAIHVATGERRILGLLKDREGNEVINSKGLPVYEQIRPKEEHTVWEPGEVNEINVIKRIFDLKSRLKYGYRKIASVLNEEGVPCPQSGKWQSREHKWASGTIGCIIRNPAYRGARVYDRLKKNGIGKAAKRYYVADQTKWKIVENAHRGIIDPETWAQANPQSHDSEKGRLAKKRFDNPYLLSGLIVCSHCGFSFNGRAQQLGVRGNRKTRRTYADSGNLSKGSTVCTFMSFDADKFEQDVLSEIKKVVLSSSTEEKVRSMVEDYYHDRSKNKGRDSKVIEEKQRELDQKIKSLLSLAELGVNMEEVATRLKELDRQKVELEYAHKSCDAIKEREAYDDTIAKKVAEFFSNFESHFEKAPISERKALVHQVVEKIVIDQKTRVAKCYLLKIPRQDLGLLDKKRDVNEKTSLMCVSPTGHA
jgi:site-specific DNA recombinase